MYKCNNCGYESKAFFALCPKCKDGIGEEVESSIGANANARTFGNGGYRETRVQGKTTGVRVYNMNSEAEEEKVCRVTQFDGLNRILSKKKGFIASQVVLLAASPGVGKSTLCSTLSDNALYISSEESFAQVKNRIERVNHDRINKGEDVDCDIVITTSIDEVLDAIKTTDKELIIVDSLNSIEFGVGYITVAKFCNYITQEIKIQNKCGIIISQVAKNGETAGSNAIPHIVDTIIHFEKSEVSNDILCFSSKNRFGEVGEIATFKHQDDSFVEVDKYETIEEPEIGSTMTEVICGCRKIPLKVDALVVPSQAQYGTNKVIGYNFNKIAQVVGIIEYYSGGVIKLGSKDVYVATSSGIYTEDSTLELAIANSIISSYFGDAFITCAKGSLRLNGKVIDGECEINGKKRKVTSIREFINMYKEGA